MTENNFNNYFKAVIILASLIFILIGFALGYIYTDYIYGDEACIKDPLVYGINALNNYNDDNFHCTCNSQSGKIDPFSFTGEGVEVEETNYFLELD